jgi:hypothetical protein
VPFVAGTVSASKEIGAGPGFGVVKRPAVLVVVQVEVLFAFWTVPHSGHLSGVSRRSYWHTEHNPGRGCDRRYFPNRITARKRNTAPAANPINGIRFANCSVD